MNLRSDAHPRSAFDFGFAPDPDAKLAPLRDRIAAAHRADEATTVKALVAEAKFPPEAFVEVQALATKLATAVRADRSQAGGVDALMLEFSLDSREGVALMCVAEALLRIPDAATRDRLIRDKIGGGDWRAHVGASPSLFVNAAAWGLLVTGRLVDTRSEGALEQAFASLLRKGGEPLIRKGVDLAMRLLGRQFVTGRTIDEALGNAREREARGYTYSFDMLGEAALTGADAQRYFDAYEAGDPCDRPRRGGPRRRRRAGHLGEALGAASALSPRAARTRARRTRPAARRAREAGQAATTSASRSTPRRPTGSTCRSTFWRGSPPIPRSRTGTGSASSCRPTRSARGATIDWIVALARQHRRRLMLRLVKGAYWDTEIKRAQVDGMPGYPVFTRKVHTDVAYLACAKAMLAAPDALYPQFASHNAFTIAAVHTLAGAAQYEFQCLHGMGESIYDQVIGPDKLGCACRIYAPVGSHETLLAYLVRRLLENGANSSFVNRIVDPAVSIASLVEDPMPVRREDRRRAAREPADAGGTAAGPPQFGGRRSRRRRRAARACARARCGIRLRSTPAPLLVDSRANRRDATPADARYRQSGRPRRPRRTRDGGDDRRRRARDRGGDRRGRAVVAHERRRARRMSRTRRRSARGGARALHGAGGARGGQDARECGRRGARGGRFLRYYAGEARANARRGCRWARSSRSRPGIFRWRSSSDR